MKLYLVSNQGMNNCSIEDYPVTSLHFCLGKVRMAKLVRERFSRGRAKLKVVSLQILLSGWRTQRRYKSVSVSGVERGVKQSW